LPGPGGPDGTPEFRALPRDVLCVPGPDGLVRIALRKPFSDEKRSRSTSKLALVE